jgi:polysaccharide export outer membrane protein
VAIPIRYLGFATCLAVGIASGSGCTAFFVPLDPRPVTPLEPAPESDVPRELAKVSLPTYVIEPPDILLIDAVKLVPKPPHVIEIFDRLGIRAAQPLLEEQILGIYSVDPDGKIDLGPSYGKVEVRGLTLDEARTAIIDHLRAVLADPTVSVTIAESAGAQPITGEHLVSPDGTVNLGTYGRVYIAGMTIPQAKQAIEQHLTAYLEEPEVIVDILAFNSKSYYVITE